MIFYFPGKPIAKKRHRMSRTNAYDPQMAEKCACIAFAKKQSHEKKLHPLDGPVVSYMKVECQIPASWAKKRKKESVGKSVAVKPDIDNYEKFYFDVLKGIAFHDDGQISSSFTEKIYSDKPGVRIELFELGKNMVNEHAITYKNALTEEEIWYLVKKAHKIGLSQRHLTGMYQEEKDDGTHLYFIVEPLKGKEL